MGRRKPLPGVGTILPGQTRLYTEPDKHAKLEVVIKCDTAGSVEAVAAVVEAMHVPGVIIKILQAGVGNVSKRDVLMCQTGDHLILGLKVDVVPRLDTDLAAGCVEIRLYNVIYDLTKDLEKIAQSFRPVETGETILGQGRVIAVFPAGRKGIVIGCEILEGSFFAGKPFRLISAMGPVFTGRITSLQIERQAVPQAHAGQNAGIFLPGRRNATIGDQVECFEPYSGRKDQPWHPTCGIFYKG